MIPKVTNTEKYSIFSVLNRYDSLQSTLLPGLGKDHIIHCLFILRQFQPMHLAFPARQNHLKQTTI